jgi:putative spermidine/putrescine transport system ATP-binding protein
MANVELENVTKVYEGGVKAVDAANIAVDDKEFVVLVGPSGCGKSTTLRMIAGLEEITSGDLLIDGKVMNDVAPKDRDIAMVFQNYALFPHMTVEENLAFPLEARKMPKDQIKEKIDRALAMVRLGEFSRRRPAQLSGGQQQRVAVARALVYEPRLVLMDEPLGALDRQLRENMQYELKHIHETVGVTVVYVTHDQGEALTMSNRIAVFNEGEVQQIATPQVLYEEPDNAFVAQFIGENNRLMGTVKVVNGNECRVEIDSGGEVAALAVNIAGVGQRTTLSLRPESVKIDPPRDGYPDRFEARVEELIYLGDHTRVRVNVCLHDDFIVKVPRSGDAPRLEVGETRTVGWNPADCRALDA